MLSRYTFHPQSMTRSYQTHPTLENPTGWRKKNLNTHHRVVWGDGGVPPLDRTYLSSLSLGKMKISGDGKGPSQPCWCLQLLLGPFPALPCVTWEISHCCQGNKKMDYLFTYPSENKYGLSILTYPYSSIHGWIIQDPHRTFVLCETESGQWRRQMSPVEPEVDPAGNWFPCALQLPSPPADTSAAPALMMQTQGEMHCQSISEKELHRLETAHSSDQTSGFRQENSPSI